MSPNGKLRDINDRAVVQAGVWRAFVVMTLIFSSIALLLYWGRLALALEVDGAAGALRAIALYLPGTIAISMPVALFLLGIASNGMSVAASLRVGLLAAILNVFLLGWIVPASNAATLSFLGSSVRDVRELSVMSLIQSDFPRAASELVTRGVIVFASLLAAVAGVAARKQISRLVTGGAAFEPTP
ncbi:MAG TPA: hypothetical protein VNJ02_10480 [Vicinamibacterales bacterium]|nr:hypothetical protein [Vicinamibacterales bacterium]